MALVSPAFTPLSEGPPMAYRTAPAGSAAELQQSQKADFSCLRSAVLTRIW